MVENQTIIKQKVQAFLLSAGSVFPIKKVLLFGSWAKGTPRKDSDIDVAVVVDCDDHTQRVHITSKLFHHAFPVDPRIEPKCVFWDEYQHPEPASILSEILRTGIEIV
ncbi:MAG: nucleotidyltransferase domain-containing protein [Planctomycetota bacterium]|jgi:predicted nucleotidyltransferase